MPDIAEQARIHYQGEGLLERVKKAVAALATESEPLTVEQLAPMDQFHTRGLIATLDLAKAAQIAPGMRVLDLGSGVGGPARVLAAHFGCDVTGVDLSASFVETATWLSARCGLSDQTRFLVGDATQPPVEPGSFNLVLLQHVAMNIADRAALYRTINRVLEPGGTLASYDVVARSSDIFYPCPWARDAAASFLLGADETRAAIEEAGFAVQSVLDNTQTAIDWVANLQQNGPPSGPGLGVVLGPDAAVMTGNLVRNLREGRVSVVTIIAKSDGLSHG